MSKEYITYTTLLSISQEDKTFLQKCMDEILHYTTRRYVKLKKDKKLGKYDKDDCDDYCKTQTFINHKNQIKTILDARYSRAIDIDLQARHQSSIACQALELEQKNIKKDRLQKRFDKAQRKYNNSKKSNLITQSKNLEQLNYLNDELNRINSRIKKLKYNIKHNLADGIVFGGKSFFHEQHKKNVNLEKWKQEWKNRACEFECGGSLSENYGNQQFQMTISKIVGTKVFFNIKINVPYRLRAEYGNSYVIKDIYFPRGQDIFKENVEAHTAYLNAMSKYEKELALQEKIEKNKNKENNNETIIVEELQDNLEKNNENKVAILEKPKAQEFGCQSVSMLFKKKRNGEFYLHVSTPRQKVKITTNDKNGVMAVDVNHDNISVAEINKVGQLLNTKVYYFNFGQHYSSSHREQMINQALNDIVEYAKSKNKHVVMEYLEFFNKKAEQLKGIEKDYNRMLHSLSYAKIGEKLRINCFLQGVKLCKVSAAYSSMLGKTLYAKKYGISTHEAAAYVLGRRHYKLKETYVSPKLNFIFRDKVCRLTIPGDIFKAQGTIKDNQFYKKLHSWLSNEMKATSRFYNGATFKSSVDQPAKSQIEIRDVKYE